MGGKCKKLAPTLHAQAWAGAAFLGETSDPSPKTKRGGSPCGGRAVRETRRDARAERGSLLPLERNACLPGCVCNATPRSHLLLLVNSKTNISYSFWWLYDLHKSEAKKAFYKKRKAYTNHVSQGIKHIKIKRHSHCRI